MGEETFVFHAPSWTHRGEDNKKIQYFFKFVIWYSNFTARMQSNDLSTTHILNYSVNWFYQQPNTTRSFWRIYKLLIAGIIELNSLVNETIFYNSYEF